MRNAEKHLIFWIITLLILLPSSMYLGYKFGYKDALKKATTVEVKTKQPKKEKEKLFLAKEEKKVVKPGVQRPEKKKETQLKPQKHIISCEEAKNNIMDFLSYLSRKKYISKYCKDRDIKVVISEIVRKLSKNPPVSQGEGANSEVMLKNIYFFFRTLSSNEIRLLKEILQKESDQIEYVMKWAYVWLINQDRCPDPYGLLPSLDVAYRYACFFLNTIGGRAYLFRRPDPVRILFFYYSVLVIQKMEQKGKNIYGIDISSVAKRLKKELKRYPELVFQKEYISTLEEFGY